MKKHIPKKSYLKQVYVTQTKGFVDVSPKRTFWKEMANEFNGVFKITRTVSRDLEILKLKIPFENIEIEFTESDSHPFKICFEIESEKEISFSISIQDIFEKIFKVFRKHDIILGDTIFDKQYLVKGNDEKLTKNIINYKTVKQLILKTNIFSFICEYNKKNKKLEIISLVGRSVNSKENMKDIYYLVTSIIEKLKIELLA